MDMITLAMAKKYTDQKAGYVEYSEGTITWDGDTTAKMAFNGSSLGYADATQYVRVTEKVIGANSIKKIEVATVTGKLVGIYDAFNIATDDGITSISVEGLLTPVVLIFDTPDAPDVMGVYVLAGYVDIALEEMNYYVSIIQGNFTETIHPIDPKYLPGVCLPVVELSTTATADGAELTTEESAAMDAVVSLGVPAVVKFTDYQGMNMSAVFSHQWMDGFVHSYVFMIGQTEPSMYGLVYQDGVWKFVLA